MGTERRSRLKGKEISSGGNSVSLDVHKLDVYILMNIVTSSCCKPIYIVIVNVKNSTNKCIVIAKLLCVWIVFSFLFFLVLVPRVFPILHVRNGDVRVVLLQVQFRLGVEHDLFKLIAVDVFFLHQHVRDLVQDVDVDRH